ncbi:MAG: SET domain-containing protein-lysine N-methyltransferase [Pseudomonadota bacterium]
MRSFNHYNAKVEKRTSPISGTGLFAREPLVRHEIVVVKGGYVMTMAERDAVYELIGPTEIQIDDGLFIGPVNPSEREAGMMHLNHSCAPNVGIWGDITFVAMRDIAAGEELNIDYAMTDNEPGIAMPCSCGAQSCRGVVTGEDWTLPDLQARYEGYFSAYLQRKLEAV